MKTAARTAYGFWNLDNQRCLQPVPPPGYRLLRVTSPLKFEEPWRLFALDRGVVLI